MRCRPMCNICPGQTCTNCPFDLECDKEYNTIDENGQVTTDFPLEWLHLIMFHIWLCNFSDKLRANYKKYIPWKSTHLFLLILTEFSCIWLPFMVLFELFLRIFAIFNLRVSRKSHTFWNLSQSDVKNIFSEQLKIYDWIIKMRKYFKLNEILKCRNTYSWILADF